MGWFDHHKRAFLNGVSVCVLLAACCIALSGCGKEEEVDPVEFAKSTIPQIEYALNRRDIVALKELGTSKFEANRFITDVFTHGVRGAVSLEMVRVRHVPDDLHMILRATFGGGTGGMKELTVYFVGENNWKIDSYSLKDKSLPPPLPGGNPLDSLPAQAAPTDPS